jgi:hypothetical protein
MIPPLAQARGLGRAKWSAAPFRSPDGEPAPHFRHDLEAEAYAERHRPFSRAFGPLEEGYAGRYGARAAAAAQICRDAFARGDLRGLHIRALSLTLMADHPDLFEPRPNLRRRTKSREKERK